ncbi:hypothetical protein Tter_1917 [Thermobaculum terrenum ATCC BAA-798]|uniref:Uncharacterized protein n=1 Tax=Thermobaculum terrenum (strain ATCC BAA-798 / CCMEE 7001 / YNP1) TaxID=525904 RepID=D1CGF2_THET1|nr:hypothetical protein [Thermobaculum terrenum]ACZ42823.1 hypothetical protein Tter_1917 [Thermobaculum terrenum ATCC BAA-798]
MKIIARILKIVRSRHHACEHIGCTAREVPEWGTIELPELKREMLAFGPIVGVGPSQ